MEAIEWVGELERATAPRPAALEAEAKGEARDRRIDVHGRADRIDRLADGGSVIIDYKTGAASAQGGREGFALQLGLLGLIARAGGIEGVSGDPERFEYWSLASRVARQDPVRPNKDMTAGGIPRPRARNFVAAAARLADRR